MFKDTEKEDKQARKSEVKKKKENVKEKEGASPSHAVTGSVFSGSGGFWVLFWEPLELCSI